MRYEDVPRPEGVESLWLRLKIWFHAAPRSPKPLIGNLSHLSDYERRDIGLPEPVRFADWRALRDNDWR